MMDKNAVNQLFDSFKDMKVLVIGDVMIDAYLFGKVNRISPEAPVPVVEVTRRSNRLGGAANVALNIKAMGAKPVLCSVIGRDEKAALFFELLKEDDLSAEGICQSENRITTTKFRILGNSSQMLRVDEEMKDDLDDDDRDCLLERITQLILDEKINAILFQDYDKGVISPELISDVTHLARKYKIPVSVDPKKRNFLSYQGVDLFKPNLKEMREGLNIQAHLDQEAVLFSASETLRKKMNAKAVMITLSERGVLINAPAGDEQIKEIVPAHIRQISDVSGAGDTVISVATLCLAAKTDPVFMARFANLAGGLVCEGLGVVPVDAQRLKEETIKLLLP